MKMTFTWRDTEIYTQHGLYLYKGVKITPKIVAQWVDLYKVLARYKLGFDVKPLKWLCAETVLFENCNMSLLPKSLADWCMKYLSNTTVLDEEWMLASLLLSHIGWTIK
jgi:hypothetical protein